jgi:ferredoxin
MDESREYRITIADGDEDFPCKDGQNVLRAMERLGRKGIPVGCRGGGCGICRVQVLDNGQYRTLKMSRAQISVEDEEVGMCLACKLIPQGDLRIRPLGLLRKKLSN